MKTRRSSRLIDATRQPSGSRSTTTKSVVAPKTQTRAPSSSNNSNRTFSAAAVSNLTEEQKNKLKKKGFSLAGGTSNKKVAAYNQLSPQGKANIDKLTRGVSTAQAPTATNTQRAVQGALGYGLGTTLPMAQKLDFSVLPGNKGGPLFTPSFTTSGSTVSGETAEGRAQAAASAAQNKEQLSKALTVGSFTPVGLGASTAARAAVGGAKVAAKGAGVFSKMFAKLSKTQKATALKGLEKQAAKGSDEAASALKKLGMGTDDVARVAQTVGRTQTAVRLGSNVISGLGALVIGGALVSKGISSYNSTNNAPSVRNAVPSGGGGGATAAPTTTQGDSGGSTPSTTTQTTQATATPTTAASTASHDASTAGAGTPVNSARPQYLSKSSPGQRDSGAVSIEPQDETLTAAQARAMELQRAQAPEAGVGVAPVGDAVDMQGLAALRDRTRALIDQYGTDAMSMPEYQSNVQQLLASNLANLNKTQPTMAEPILDTPEKLDWLNQFPEEERFSMQEFSDNLERELGMTERRSKIQDLNKDLEALKSTYREFADYIKANPNLPKGLAVRRLEEHLGRYEHSANSVLAEIGGINDELDELERKHASRKGYKREDIAAEEKERERRINEIGWHIESGSIGGMTDRALMQWSQATGIPYEALQANRDNALEPDKNYDVRWENDEYGNTYQIITDQNDPLAEPTIRNVGQLSRNYRSGGSGSADTSSRAAYTEKTVPTELKGEAINWLQNIGEKVSLQEFMASFDYTLDDALAQKLYDSYYTPPAEPETAKEPAWWQFWK